MAQKRGLGDRAPSLAFFVFAYCWQLFWYTTLGCVASCQIWGRTIQLASVWSRVIVMVCGALLVKNANLIPQMTFAIASCCYCIRGNKV